MEIQGGFGGFEWFWWDDLESWNWGFLRHIEFLISSSWPLSLLITNLRFLFAKQHPPSSSISLLSTSTANPPSQSSWISHYKHSRELLVSRLKILFMLFQSLLILIFAVRWYQDHFSLQPLNKLTYNYNLPISQLVSVKLSASFGKYSDI